MKAERTFLAAAALLLSATHAAEAIVGPSADGAAFADRVVMVLSRGVEGSGFCTGIVLAPRIVLTAAHCLRRPADTLVLYRDGDGAPVAVAVEATATHPRYRADAIRRRVVSVDLGLLETVAALPPSFHSAILADRDAEIGEATTIVGFGVTREGEPKSGGAPRSASLRVRAPASKILLWAENPEQSDAGACSGDSGAPIFAADRQTVLAVVAWTAGDKGRRCGGLTQGPLVAPARPWIDTVLAAWRR
jgi:hypothetical protein